jgi:hypothetical protein
MADATKKPFRLKAEEIVSLAQGYGSCFATDMITCEGRKVAFMYREKPDREVDSGWRFLSGDESDEYMNDPDNLAIYDVNTIANYDPDIIPFLNAPIGSAFERPRGEGDFVEVHDFEPPNE